MRHHQTFPFFLQFIICFFALDGVEKVVKFFLGLNQGLPLGDMALSFYASTAILSFLAFSQLLLRVSFVHWWISFYLGLLLVYQALFFSVIAPEVWVSLGPLGRFGQIFTALIHLTILLYFFSDEWYSQCQ